jgi:hypothetical protein
MRMRRTILAAALVLPLAASEGMAQRGAPHEWLYGAWIGGFYPAIDATGPQCFAQPAVIFTRDVVMRTSAFDVSFRQRLVETVAGGPAGVEFRLLPAGQPGRVPADIGFGCDGNPNLLRVEPQGENEIVFPNCTEFPLPLRRCVTR